MIVFQIQWISLRSIWTIFIFSRPINLDICY